MNIVKGLDEINDLVKKVILNMVGQVDLMKK